MGDAAQWVRGLVGTAFWRGWRTRAASPASARARHPPEDRPARATTTDDGDSAMARSLAARACAGGRSWPCSGILALYWPTGRVDRRDLDTLGDVHARFRRRADLPVARLAAPRPLARDAAAAVVARARRSCSAAGALWLVASVGDVIGVRQFALAFMLTGRPSSRCSARALRVLPSFRSPSCSSPCRSANSSFRR